MYLTYDEWLETYKPIRNPFNKDLDVDPMRFDTEGEQHAFVRKQPLDNVWTEVAVDRGSSIINGWHFVNRICYYICETPVDPELDLEVIVPTSDK
jgi:hypothetical protein